ncbi:MAG: peptide deformylase [Bryobacteraceae bacterium]
MEKPDRVGEGRIRLKIAQVGEAVLRQRARILSTAEVRSSEIQELIEWMRATMQDAPGVGLAAPQVGLSLQLAVIEDKPEYTRDAPAETIKARERKPVPFHVIINPKLMLGSGSGVEFFEGCLSLGGFTALVPRARDATVECLDHRGEPKVIHASGWYARILQHEIDHLQGTLYIDRMHSHTFMTVENFNRYWKDKPVTELRELIRQE